MTIFRLITATLLPALVAVAFYLAEKKTSFSRLSYRYKQIVIGIAFGAIAILATEFGIPVDGAVLNVRTAAPLTAGLLFGGPAGIIAGIIGGAERWFSVYWGGGAYTRLACTLATVMAGFFAAVMRKYMFDNKKASFTAGLTIGLTTEVLHMLLVFLTNMSDIHTAFAVVQKCAPPMILLNATAVALALGAVKLLGGEKKKEERKTDKEKEHKQIAQIFRSGLLICVVAAFVVTCVFTTVLQIQIAKENTEASLKTALNDVQTLIDGKNLTADEVETRVAAVVDIVHPGQSGYLVLCKYNGGAISKSAELSGKSLEEIGLSIGRIPSDTVKMTELAETSVRLMYRRVTTAAGDYTVIAVLPESEAVFTRNTSVYITAFMEILVFAVLFVNVYFMTKRVVVDNIHKVNDSLAKIAGGNLNVQVNVRENEEFASLTDDINSTVSTLKHYIAEAAARIDKELEFAKAIQHSALPSVFPPYPNRKDFDIFALMDTAKEVGGDFYDFYLLDNDRLGFLIADVSGKGIPAAMFMMTAKTVIKGLAESGVEVNDIFTQANATLCDGNETGMFVTAWIGILDLRTGLLSFANAGHNPPLIRHKDGSFEFLRTRPNFILAGMSKTKYKKQELQLSPGDELFLYTDGVTEAKNTDKQMFREEKLMETLNVHPDEGVEKRCKNLLREIGVFVGEAEQFDDITMLSVKLNHLQTFDRIVVCPDLESTDAVWEFIDFKIKKAELPKKLATRLKVCTDEIYSNILRYSKATKAEIFCRIDENLLTLVFRDNGIPYDPTASTEPDITLSARDREIGGLGIYMVKKSVKTINYEYLDNQNVLTLTFDF